MINIRICIGLSLRQARKAKKITLAKVVEDTKITKRTLINIELGYYGGHPETIDKLLSYYGYDVTITLKPSKIA